MKTALITYCTSVLFLLIACGESPSLVPLGTDAKILAFGDSLTFGTGAKAPESYPAVLSQLSAREVIRSGVPGELSGAGLRRLPQVLAEHQPDLVILCHGGNDLLRKQSRAAAAQNIETMIRSIQDIGAQVILVGVPAPSLLLSDADFYEQVAEKTEVLYAEGIVSSILADAALKSDPAHPNAAGYRKFAQELFELMRSAGAF